ncbi:aminotransferase class I/II-fold pyridoxal phosphate-dependent enzyme [Govanella unica]|uniref:Aminotransferase class I/II-fold pyridoxal phosphate-dependent enzyme n=1 Tax=Govanella unica TaxID=2975056 RepID=A0A9X3Z5V6_9PROT|nr:aminotransferase class I/II-fold pyridoxal phosphate-dependent enzyme [Govania unica]MDA5192437.1 aminotransferase class I/II-fold pyridoxal phosphate-dependent enzyme [Govania unica]
MRNPRLGHLPEYAFPRLRALLDGIAAGQDPIDMTIGEPRHGMPDFVADILVSDPKAYGKYPPIGGTPEWCAAVSGWLTRRYGLGTGMIDPARHVLPLNGTREGLFSITFVTVPPEKQGQRPLVLMPNPFYQCYTAAALAAGADPVYVAATRETGFMPDFAGLGEATLGRSSLVYLCSPANPQGAVASPGYLRELIALARQHDFVLAVDECYAEIYGDVPPTGALEVCQAIASEDPRYAEDPFANVLVFHSLSKRSSLPGLRSGFVAGDPQLIADFRLFRNYIGPASPLPTYAAAAAAWNDETHVEANRDLYRAKFDLAARILGNRFGFYRPAGGFFLWLDVSATRHGDGETAALALWREAGVRVLPGAYLSQDGADGVNPGRDYVRVALVDDLQTTERGLLRLAETLGS